MPSRARVTGGVRHIVILGVLLSGGPALALPDLGANSWTGIGSGTANSAGNSAADPMLGGFLYVKWAQDEAGRAEGQWAEVGAGPGVQAQRQIKVIPFTITIAETLHLRYSLSYTGNLGLVNPGCVPPGCREIIQIGGGLNVGVETTIDGTIQVPWAAAANVKVRGLANGAVDTKTATDGPHAPPAVATATAEASKDGVHVDIIDDAFTTWGLFTRHLLSIDGGDAKLLGDTEFSKDKANDYTFKNITDTGGLVDGQGPTGNFTVNSFFDVFVELTPGQHTLEFTDMLTGYLIHEQKGHNVPAPAGLGLLALPLALLAWRRRRG